MSYGAEPPESIRCVSVRVRLTCTRRPASGTHFDTGGMRKPGTEAAREPFAIDHAAQRTLNGVRISEMAAPVRASDTSAPRRQPGYFCFHSPLAS